MKYTIKHIKNLLDNKLELIPKHLGVELVNLGFLKYKKLTSKNYNYWWYEVADNTKIDKNKFTYNWNDMKLTRKCRWFSELIEFHKDSESIYNIITPILSLESAINEIDKETGRKQTEIIKEKYYGNKSKK